MRTRMPPRSPVQTLVLAAAVAPLALVASASAATTYSTTPTTVYSATTAGYNSLTVGLNSTSSTAAVIDPDPSVIAGYETKTGTLRSIYYLTPATGAVTTVAIPDNSVASSPFHVTNTGTPTLVQVSSTGTLYGAQTRTNVAGGTASLGSDAFTYTPTTSTTGTYNVTTVPTAVLGGGASYTYTATSGTTTLGTAYRFSPTTGSISATASTGNQVGTDGSVTGTITRFVGDANATTNNPANTGLGSDAFYLGPTGTTTAIGFTGPIGTTGETYDQLGQDSDVPSLIAHGTSVTGMAGTAAVGYTSRYATGTSSFSNGQDAFRYTPATGTAQIGLVGGIYTSGVVESSTPTRTNTAGQIAGTSVIENTTATSSGTDAWLYTPSTTTPGTAATFGTSSAGTYARLGLIATPTATAVGNVSPTNGARLSRVAFLEPGGTASGVSSRYDTSGTGQGNAAYYFNGTTNVDISPVDAIHPVANGGVSASTNTITAMNNTGMVAGVATRIGNTALTSGTAGNSLGQDAYVYDGNSEFFVDPTDESTAGAYEFSTIGAISDGGEAVGLYETFTGTSSTPTGAELFVWNETTGLQGLMSFTAAQAQTGTLPTYVDSFTFGPDGTLYGPNTFTSGTNLATSVVAYAPVPEPASAGLLAVAAVGALARRRRRTA